MASGPIKVLVADDNPINKALLEAWVRKLGNCELIGSASDGVEAVEQVITSKPDLLLLDYLMPRLDGIEATRILRKLESPVKIIIISAASVEIPWADAGAQAFLSKVGIATDLTKTIHSLFPENFS